MQIVDENWGIHIKDSYTFLEGVKILEVYTVLFGVLVILKTSVYLSYRKKQCKMKKFSKLMYFKNRHKNHDKLIIFCLISSYWNQRVMCEYIVPVKLQLQKKLKSLWIPIFCHTPSALGARLLAIFRGQVHRYTYALCFMIFVMNLSHHVWRCKLDFSLYNVMSDHRDAISLEID